VKIISWAFMALLALAIIILSIGNKAPVPFSLFPLPFEMELPLFILILAGGFIGLLLGSFRTWVSDGKSRKKARSGNQEILRLKGEISRLQNELQVVEGSSAAGHEGATPNASFQQQKLTDQRT
jgi:uncharacterized integral membrane protein